MSSPTSVRTRLRSGFTMIETLIGISLLTFLLLALFSLIVSNLATLFTSKARATGLGLAQEKLENLKNLPYDSLSTLTGTVYPAGTIPDDELLTRNNLHYRVHTDIRYVDDAYDGDATGSIAGKPVDTYPYDYKKVTIQVFADGNSRKYAELSTNIAARAAETAGNTGVLIVHVINANGQPVDAASVTISNATVSPAVNIQTTSDILGQVIVPKLPPDAGKDYHIAVNKGGYSSDQTYPTTVQYPSPSNPDFVMVAQQTVTKTFGIDQLANLTAVVKDPTGTTLANKSVTVHGQKITNTTPAVYKYTQTLTTDNNGQIQLNLIEWDSYSLTVSGLTVLATTPYQPVSLAPNSFVTTTLTASASSTTYPVITSVTPSSAAPTSGVNLDITGSNITASSTIRLQQSGQADRVATGVTFASPNTLSGTVDLSGATGSWDVIITTGSYSTTQSAGLVIQ